LLGLNLKYCLAANGIADDINKTILRMARNIRTNHYLTSNNNDNDTTHKKQIYKKNLTWHPPPAPLIIEDKITEFEKALKRLQQKYAENSKNIKLSNLNSIQINTLQSLCQNPNIIIKPTDKNLGPATMDSIDYAKQVLQEHLLTNTYKQLSETEATTRMIELKDALKNLISTHSHNLSKVELTYFQRSL
jgi:hypothetical protein